jgi:hypothetical protein
MPKWAAIAAGLALLASQEDVQDMAKGLWEFIFDDDADEYMPQQPTIGPAP